MTVTTIVGAVALVAIIGFIAGLGLAIASIVMAVPKDEKAEAIRESLPGANCGACGFSGCDGYAAALSKGETTETTLCAPGGNEAAKGIAQVLGVEAGSLTPTAAMVMCKGNNETAVSKYRYQGVESCRMANQLMGGPKECTFGCIGLGDCVAACEYGAISIVNGVAVVDKTLCKACKKCVRTCPKGIIRMVPIDRNIAAVACMNRDKGAVTRKACGNGCIGCMKCVKVCESEAVKVENFLAYVDPDKCTACGKCHGECPTGAIDLVLSGTVVCPKA